MARLYSPTLNIQVKAPAPIGLSWWFAKPADVWFEMTGTSPQANLTIPSLGFPFESSGPKTILDHWGGMSVRHANVELGFGGGGHADYAGNAQIGCVLDNGVGPQWFVRLPNTISSLIQPQSPSLNSGVRRYDDGRPSSYHSYYSRFHMSVHDETWLAGRGALWGNGNGSSDFVERYKHSIHDWRPASECTTQFPNMALGGTALCQHPDTEDIYGIVVGGAAALRRLNASDCTVTTIGNTNLASEIYNPICVDPPRSRILVTPNGGTPSWKAVSLSTGAASNYSTTGDTSFNFGSGHLTWDPHQQRILCITNAMDVVALNPATGVLTQLNLGTKPPAANVSGSWGLFSKCQYVPRLHGLIAAPRWSANLWGVRFS